MPAVPSWTSLALLLGPSFFSGLAFEEFYRKTGEERPGGIRTFPLLAIGGGGADLPLNVTAAAILVATASNDLLKASYAAVFAGWRVSLPAVASLASLAALTIVAAFLVGGG